MIDTISPTIIELLAERLQIEVSAPDEDIIEAGLLDSLGLVELMAALEETFAIHISFDEIEIDNFRSARRITEFVAARVTAKECLAA